MQLKCKYNHFRSIFRVDAPRKFVERLMPNKSLVLEFLDKNDLIIDTWARVVVTGTKAWGGKDGGISEWMVSQIFVFTKLMFKGWPASYD
jgi:hypothetical protein